MSFVSDGSLGALLHKYDRIILFGHEYIDGDCLGGMLGLGRILETMGKSVSYHTPIQPGSEFSFLVDIDKLTTHYDYPNDDQCLFFIDFTPYDRIPGFTKGHEEYFDRSYKIVIDHHPDPRIWGDVEYKDVSASSVCERLYELISGDKILSAYLDQHVATYLLMGVMTDTGNFVYEKDSRRTFKAALGLLDAGANKPFLVDGLYRHMKKEVLELGSLVWSRIQTKGHVMSMRYTEQELDTYGLEKGDLSKVLSIASSIEGNRVIVVVRSVGSMLKGSLRSKGGIPGEFDVSAICRAVLGGGGHRNASGFTLPATGTIVDQLSKIVDMINTYIDTNHQQ